MGSENHMGTIRGYNFDELYSTLLEQVTLSPQYTCKPRGSLIKEFLASTLVLQNPRARLLNNLTRNTNYGFGVGEFLWYWQGKRDLETMLYYNKRMKDFSNDGRTLNSAYGYRLRELPVFLSMGLAGTGLPQWEVVIRTFLDDPDSRRAVMHINSPEDQREAVGIGSKDVPCTLSLQFFIRDNKLDLHAVMRSNDIVWGLTYDLFSFTMFQECMLLDLKRHEKFKDLELGTYYHTAGSIHLYERHFEQAKNIVEEYANYPFLAGSSMLPITSLGDLDNLCSDERELRLGRIKEIDLSKYSGGLRWMAQELNKHREKRYKEESNP